MSAVSSKALFEEYLRDVRYLDWQFNVDVDGDSRCFLQVAFFEFDSGADSSVEPRTGEKTLQKGRKWLLSPYMTKSEVVQTAFKAVITAVEHEARENFRYKSKPIFGPHFNVDRLLEICNLGEAALEIKSKPITPTETANTGDK